MSVLLGIELRGSEAGLTVVSRKGEVIGYRCEPLSTPMHEWWGTHPEERYRAVLRLLESARRENVYEGAHVAGIGITAESGLVFLDHEHQAIAPRSVPWGNWVDLEDPDATSDLGGVLSAWAREGGSSVGVVFSPLDYLRFRMTGALSTHVHFAWSIGLSRERELASWDVQRVDELGCRPDMLPPILSAECRVGVVSEEVVEAAGVPRGVWVNAGSDPYSARLMVAAEPTPERTLVYHGTDGRSAWRCSNDPSDEHPSLPSPIGTWFHEVEVPQVLDGETVVDSDDAGILESLGLDGSQLVAVDSGGPSAGTAIQAGLGLGWWRDLRTLWRKRRHPVSYGDWVAAEQIEGEESDEAS